MVRERDTDEERPEERLGAGARALNYGASALLTALIMVGASLLLWIGVPAGWLWIGSQIQAESDSVGLSQTLFSPRSTIRFFDPSMDTLQLPETAMLIEA